MVYRGFLSNAVNELLQKAETSNPVVRGFRFRKHRTTRNAQPVTTRLQSALSSYALTSRLRLRPGKANEQQATGINSQYTIFNFHYSIFILNLFPFSGQHPFSAAAIISNVVLN
jgi:hypothetical protein